jgi:PAS domain S-box-containing protein
MTSQTAAFTGCQSERREVGIEHMANQPSRESIDILDTVELPIVVIGRDSTITHINGAAASALRLGPLDVGRLPADAPVLAAVPDLMAWVSKAIAGTPSRHDFREGKRTYQLRMIPRGPGDRGAILTFTNVTAFRAIVEQAISDREYTKALLNAVPDPLVVLDEALCIRTANRAFHAIFEVSREEIQGRPLRQVQNGMFDLPGLQLRLEAPAHRAFEPFQLDQLGPGRNQRTFLLVARHLASASQGTSNILLCFHDITARKRTEDALARQAEEQVALNRLTNRLQRAETLAETYKAALESIIESLGCDRASILLFDDLGVMRFVAWHGLSERYRKAVEGHSPWKQGARDPLPISVPDIDIASEPDSLKSVVRAEGIRALSFFPLVVDGGVIGKFMTYYQALHEFTAEEVDFASMIARQLGFSIERKRAEEARRTLAAIVASSHDAIISKDLDGVIGSWNGGAERMFGYAASEIVGKPVTLLIPVERLEEEDNILSRIRRGEGVECETVRRRKDGSLVDVSLTVSPIYDGGGRIVGVSKIARDITDRRRHERHQKTLVNELNHRVKNTLASVQSIASQTLRHSSTAAEAEKQITGRLVALSQAHDVLTKQSWEGAPLHQLVSQAVAPHCVPGVDRFDVEGPDIWLSPKSALAVTMALHELCTNAVKYGALSNDAGRVTIVWTVAADNSGPRLRLRWTERGGPKVEPPRRRGFGSRLVEHGLSHELGGEVRIVFDPSGVVCTIDAPVGADAPLQQS